VALDASWAGTGSRAVGATPFTTLTPTWLVAKGFVLLPESMKLLRPFGVTAQVGKAPQVPPRLLTKGDESARAPFHRLIEGRPARC
jgi:hypothetical protein